MLGIFAKSFMTASRTGTTELSKEPHTLNEHRFFIRPVTSSSRRNQ
ncbi:hypothetical protein [Roseovarius albus]|nr:hypothetical protein [Roseovarius albus]